MYKKCHNCNCIVLTSSELQIYNALLPVGKYLTAVQINQLLNTNVNNQQIYKHLTSMMAKGIVNHIPGHGNNFLWYIITKEGA